MRDPRKRLSGRGSSTSSSAQMTIIQLTRRSNKLRVVAPPILLAENVGRTLTAIIQLKLLLLCQLPVTQLQVIGNLDPDNQTIWKKLISRVFGWQPAIWGTGTGHRIARALAVAWGWGQVCNSVYSYVLHLLWLTCIFMFDIVFCCSPICYIFNWGFQQ